VVEARKEEIAGVRASSDTGVFLVGAEEAPSTTIVSSGPASPGDRYVDWIMLLGVLIVVAGALWGSRLFLLSRNESPPPPEDK
jgi:hypothetical protein